MNKKIEKLGNEIEKTEEKIAEMQERVRNMKRQKVQMEDDEIVSVVRNIDIPPEKLKEVMEMMSKGEYPQQTMEENKEEEQPIEENFEEALFDAE